jgi:GNAT superfamily N-acetyltransferase
MILTIQIRRATPADAGVVAEFNAQLAQETEGLNLNRAQLRHGVEQVLDDPSKGFYWLAEVKGQVVGQLLVTYEWSDWRNGWFWWIQSVFVRKDWRGRGVFEELYEFVERQAADRSDVCGLRLYVDADNARAKRTYERLGLERTHYEIYEVDFRKGAASRRTSELFTAPKLPSGRRS